LNATAADQLPVPTLSGFAVTAITAAAAIVMAANASALRRQSDVRHARTFELGVWRCWIALAVWALVALIVILPLGNLIYKAGATVVADNSAFMRGWSLWKAVRLTATSPSEFAREFKWSTLMAICSALLTMGVAIGLGFAARTSKIAGALALIAAVAALAVPGPIVSLGLITVFNHPDFPRLNYLYDRTIAVAVIAQSIRALPLALFVMWYAFRSLSQAFVEASLLDGAGWIVRAWLMLRQRLAAVAVAGAAVAVLSLGELSATLLVVPPGIEPLSVRLFSLLHYNVEDQVAAITLMLVSIHAVVGWLILTIHVRAFR
jgi:iron(III) transport system permease protein